MPRRSYRRLIRSPSPVEEPLQSDYAWRSNDGRHSIPITLGTTAEHYSSRPSGVSSHGTSSYIRSTHATVSAEGSRANTDSESLAAMNKTMTGKYCCFCLHEISGIALDTTTFNAFAAWRWHDSYLSSFTMIGGCKVHKHSIRGIMEGWENGKCIKIEVPDWDAELHISRHVKDNCQTTSIHSQGTGISLSASSEQTSSDQDQSHRSSRRHGKRSTGSHRAVTYREIPEAPADDWFKKREGLQACCLCLRDLSRDDQAVALAIEEKGEGHFRWLCLTRDWGTWTQPCWTLVACSKHEKPLQELTAEGELGRASPKPFFLDQARLYLINTNEHFRDIQQEASKWLSDCHPK